MDRRAIIGALLVVTLAGCLGAAGGDLYPAKVTDDVAEEHGYELGGYEVMEIEEDIEGETVETEIKVSGYGKAVDASSMEGDEIDSLYAIISTPPVEVGGQEMSPLAHTSTAALLDYAEEFADFDVELHQQTDDHTVSHEPTDSDVTVEEYDASVDLGGIVLDGTLLFGAIETDDGVLFALGAYAEQVEERESILAMMAASDTTDELDGIESDQRDADAEDELTHQVQIHNSGEQSQDVTYTISKDGDVLESHELELEGNAVYSERVEVDDPDEYELEVTSNGHGEAVAVTVTDDGEARTMIDVLPDGEVVVETESPVDTTDAAFPNNIEVRNEASAQAVTVGVYHEDDLVAEEELEIGEMDAAMIPDVIPEAGEYTVSVDADSDTTETTFTIEDNTRDIGIALRADGDVLITDIPARDHEERSDEPDDTDVEGQLAVLNMDESSHDLEITVTDDGEERLHRDLELSASERTMVDAGIAESGEYTVSVRTQTGEATDTVHVDDEDVVVEITIDDGGEVTVDGPDQRTEASTGEDDDDNETRDRERDETGDDDAGSDITNDINLRNFDDSNHDVRVLVHLDGEVVLEEDYAVAAGAQKIDGNQIRESGEYRVEVRAGGATDSAELDIFDDDTDIEIVIDEDGELEVGT